MSVGAVFAATALGLDNKIYVISGSTQYDVKLTAAVRIYDPQSDSWREAAPIPTPRTSTGCAVDPNGRIYVIGGQGSERQMNVVEAYDPGLNSWARLTPLPTPRDAVQAVAAKGAGGRVRIYVIGGRGPLHDRKRENYNTVEAYDPLSETWSSRAPMPTRRHAHAATIGPDGRIYVVGGTNENVFACKILEIYDPVKDTWTTGAPMPYGQECAAIAFTSGANGEVLVFGGWSTNKIPVRRAAAYNPRTNKWRSLPPLSTARAACSAVVIEREGSKQIYIFGGTSEGGNGEERPDSNVEKSVELSLVGPKQRHDDLDMYD